VDEKLKVLRKEPLHDWASHAADAFRTAAVMICEPEKGENVNSVGLDQSPAG
jgi:phage terminase large subunit